MSGFHAATDSDFTSSFHGLGKTKGLNLLRKNDLFSDAFILIGEEANLNERTVKVINRFIFEFYGKQYTTELNHARYQIFFKKENYLILSEYRHLGIVLCFTLTHYSPVLLFYTPWKHDVFRGHRKVTPDCNGLNMQIMWHVFGNKPLFVILRSWIQHTTASKISNSLVHYKTGSRCNVGNDFLRM